MFDPKSDYALNKMAPEAIVCKSATGEHIRLTRKDFSSDEEFIRWKKWSDEDYHTEIKAGRDFYDNNVPLKEDIDSECMSAEDVLFAPLLAQEAEERRRLCVQQIKDVLTETQFRRFWMYYADAMTVEEIADMEHIAHQNVSKSIRAAWKKIKKFLGQSENGVQNTPF